MTTEASPQQWIFHYPKGHHGQIVAEHETTFLLAVIPPHYPTSSPTSSIKLASFKSFGEAKLAADAIAGNKSSDAEWGWSGS